MRILACIALTWLLCATTVVAHRGDVTAARRVLEQTFSTQPDNSHLSRLAALRALHDDGLAPVFRLLVKADDWPLQVHGVLGLAEITPDGLDPALLRLVAPPARQQIVQVAAHEGLVPPAVLQTIASADWAEDHIRATLLDPVTVDKGQLDLLLLSADPRAAGTAAALLAARGHTQALATLEQRLASLSLAEQLDAMFACLDAIGEHPTPAAIQWVVDWLETHPQAGPERYALMSLLKAGAPEGERRWQAAFDGATRYRQRVDLVLVRLMAEAPFNPAIMARLNEDPVTAAIGRAAGAVQAGAAGDPDALVALVDLGHNRSLEWFLESAPGQPSTLVQPALERLIEKVPGIGPPRTASMDLAQRAARVLHTMAPARMRQLLADAPDDGPRQQALLIAALQLNDEQLHTVASNIQQVGMNVNDTMALLLRARWSSALTARDLDRLALAIDGGRLSEPLRAQAAWLMLKHSGRLTDVMQSLTTPH